MLSDYVKLLCLITVVFIAAVIETDIFLPALPDMMFHFGVTEEMIQRLLTWNFLGICLSGPLYGPLSDSWGRRPLIFFALTLFLIGSVMTLFADNFSLMLWGRLLQGLGSGGCFTLGTAILFDAFQSDKAVRAISQLNSTVPFIMALAPMLGGALNNFYGFRSNFLAIAIFVAASLLTCIVSLKETLPLEKRKPLQFTRIAHDFRRALVCLPFWQTALIVSLIFAAYITFLSGAALLFVLEFGVSKQLFPFFQGALLGAWVVASLTCGRALARLGRYRLKMVGTGLILLGGTALLTSVWIAPKDPYGMTLAMMIFAFGSNWTQGLYFPEGMEILPDIKGVTASLLTSARLLVTALIMGLAGALYDGTIYPFLFIIAGIVLTIVPIIVFYERVQNRVVLGASSVAPH